MQDNNTKDVQDVEFKEVATKAVPAAEFFNPVTYLTNALAAAGHPNPSAWTQDIDPRAETAEEEKDRIFFANRALRLWLAEQTDRENITVRMIQADGISAIKWCALMDQGIVKWVMGGFDKKEELASSDDSIGEEAKDVQRAVITDGDTDALPNTVDTPVVESFDPNNTINS
jgi:hypothetical protein